ENMNEGIFSGDIVNQTIEGEKTFSTTGTKLILGDTVGKVKLTNELTKEQVLVATTRLLTSDNVLYRLNDRVSIPAGGSVDATVFADDDSKPLAKAGTKFTIPGLSESLQKLVYAETNNDFAADGATVKAISQEELDSALETLSEELALQVVSQEDSSNTKILTKEVIEQEFSDQVGAEVNEYTLRLKLAIVGVIFEAEPVNLYSRELLQSLVPTGRELIGSSSDNLLYEIEKYDLDNELAQIKSTINGNVILSEDSPILDRDKLIKLNFDEIKTYLENFDDVQKAEINFFPSWVKKIPYFQDHIIIKIKPLTE
ncbi:hypothetical protein ACFL2U_03935, partial [Patescibacteria group bacterium]